MRTGDRFDGSRNCRRSDGSVLPDNCCRGHRDRVFGSAELSRRHDAYRAILPDLLSELLKTVHRDEDIVSR